ncbi:hypothetical protein ERO13_D09G023150v2 [Gossypium hirsutum]|uniref:Uncharacterized protein n=2 Tax=Gossypium TaxID=3633 RepID=A0A5D2JCS2_GOSTO|nr:hypothetical protein ERO13_D09G023150v2 [Gossypium hirsutum]TYG52469.1 hypothetical protein ES288_D09G030800v1 [Gossypium darwinii]TYH52450.1 hypothetical protein ES332_D09G029100v1 [Gossypium tomentosum]
MEKIDGIGKENGSTEEKQSFKDGSICGYNSFHHLLSANLKPQLYQCSIMLILCTIGAHQLFTFFDQTIEKRKEKIFHLQR